MKTPVCPRCKTNDSCAPHECTLTWTGKGGDLCPDCGGKGGSYAPAAENPEGPLVKTICATCKGQGALNAPPEPKCRCCYSCQALCHNGLGPENDLSVHPLAL